MSNHDFSATRQIIQEGIDNGQHFGAQVSISKDGETLSQFSMGTLDGSTPLTDESIIPWMSCSKMITAVALAKCYEEGDFDFDWKVSQIIPEYACNGKEETTFKDLLTHTCGIRLLKGRWEHKSWDDAIAAICEMPIEPAWKLGESAGYHVATSWMILGEALQRITDENLNDYIVDEILEPCGMYRSFFFIPEVFRMMNHRDIGSLYNTFGATPIAITDICYQDSLLVKPGSSAKGPVSELNRFMQMIANGGEIDGTRVLEEETVELISKPYRIGKKDQSFDAIIDWGLGFMFDSKQYQEDYMYSFGPHASEGTFGHNGNQSSACYFDPKHNLVISFAFNGMPGETRHQNRLKAINKAIYEDLDLA